MDEMAHNSEPAPAGEPEQADAELAARARDGDERAFEELFTRHRRRVARIASRFFRQRQQIEEVVQETFTKVFFALGEFSNRRDASFAAWLARIAFNACYDELRRQKRRPESALLSEVTEEETERLRERLREDGTAAVDAEAAAVTRDLAAKLLARLTPEDRLLLVMLDAEGLSVAEIAGLTGWSESKVKVRAHRARASLRRVLERFL